MGGEWMKIRMLVRGHTQQEYDFEYGQSILEKEIRKGNNIINDESHQLTKIEDLEADGSYTVFPAVTGG